jgi:BolA protein
VKPTCDELSERLLERFPGARIEVVDDSHLHAGHAGSRDGAGHYTVRIAWPGFGAATAVTRHRLVYDSVREWIPSRIHALSIQASLD